MRSPALRCFTPSFVASASTPTERSKAWTRGQGPEHEIGRQHRVGMGHLVHIRSAMNQVGPDD
jgi:hypothetical protein